jgi:hypothetical protein
VTAAKAKRMTATERTARAATAVAAALAAARADDPAECNQLLTHAVHDGVQPVEIVAEIAAQTGGKL